MPTSARMPYARGLSCLRRAHFLSRQEMGERNGRGEDSDFFPPDPLFETAQGALPLVNPRGSEYFCRRPGILALPLEELSAKLTEGAKRQYRKKCAVRQCLPL